MASYSSRTQGWNQLFHEAFSLYRLHSHDVLHRVQTRLADAHLVENRIGSRYGLTLENLDMLEVGPGQFLTQMNYFAVRNRVVGIDTDVIVQGFDPAGYIRMARSNGIRRTAKTFGRKLIGVDRAYGSQLKRGLGLRRLPRLRVHAMDVRRMVFPNESFDLVYCRSVLQHLPDPAQALDEIVRILRPGAVAYVSIHPYTSETGSLDPRIYTDRRQEVAGWPHLRPSLQKTLEKSNAYLNQFRLSQWRDMFSSSMSGSSEILVTSGTESREAAVTLQAQGELNEYSLEELLAGELISLWQKPLRQC